MKYDYPATVCFDGCGDLGFSGNVVACMARTLQLVAHRARGLPASGFTLLASRRLLLGIPGNMSHRDFLGSARITCTPEPRAPCRGAHRPQQRGMFFDAWCLRFFLCIARI